MSTVCLFNTKEKLNAGVCFKLFLTALPASENRLSSLKCSNAFKFSRGSFVRYSSEMGQMALGLALYIVSARGRMGLVSTK